MIKRVICLKHKTKIIFLGMAAYTSIYTSRFRGTHMTTKSFFESYISRADFSPAEMPMGWSSFFALKREGRIAKNMKGQ